MKIEILINQILFIALCVGALFINYNGFTDEYIVPKWLTSLFFGTIIAITLSIQTLYHCSIHRTWNINYLIATILIICTTQASYGILQYINVFKNNSMIGLIGSFDNPAGFASCLCISLPLGFNLFVRNNIAIKCCIILMSIIIIFAILLSQSRTGIITIISILCIIIYYKIHISPFAKVACVILPIILIISLYPIKKGSADGRLLIWQCSMEMVKDKPILGHGVHGFKSKYMNYQADYFKKNPHSKYTILADNVSHPFNEYIFFLVNYGIVGLTLLIIVATYFYICYHKNQTTLNFSCLISLLAIAIFSFFSYPFRYPFTWIILLLNAYILSIKHLQSLKNRVFIVCMAFCLLITSTVSICHIYMHFYAEKRWNNITQSNKRFNDTKIILKYKELLPILGNDPYFLYNYATELNYLKKYSESNFIIKRCTKLYNDYDIQLLISDNYFKLHNVNMAKYSFWQAYSMCPNRFIPLYKLLKIESSCNKGDAMNLALMIIKKKEKIPSFTIDCIKKEAIIYILNNKLKK